MGNQIEILQFLACHQPGSDLSNGHAGRLCHEGHGAAGAGVYLKDIDGCALNGILHIHQANHFQRLCQGMGLLFHVFHHRIGQGIGRQRTSAVAGMNASLFNMFHDTGDMHIITVAQGIDVHFNRVTQIVIDQHGALAGYNHGGCDVTAQFRLVMDDFHRATAQDIGRADHDRIPDASGNGDCLISRGRDPIGWLAQVQILQQALEPFPVFRQINCIGRCAQDGNARLFKRPGQF